MLLTRRFETIIILVAVISAGSLGAALLRSDGLPVTLRLLFAVLAGLAIGLTARVILRRHRRRRDKK